MKKELSRMELAIVKRTAQNTKKLRERRDKITAKIEELNLELNTIGDTIHQFEAPIITMTGGFTSEEVLNGTMDATIEAFENEESVKNEVENTQENVNEVPVASNEIPYI
jgi:gas vesicle protein